MKKLTFPLLLATALVAAGCSSDENVAEIDDSQRSAIELSGANSVSRAGFTEANTTLKLHYVSTKKTETGFDDGADKGNTLYMTSSATAAVDGTNTTTSVSAVTQTTGADGQKRYWDDVHGRNSNLSIYAIAVPNKTSITKNATAFNAWDTNVKEGSATNPGNTIAWEVSTSQTLDKIADEDLAYSNNVSGENTLGFNTTSKTFEKAEGTKNLEFNHALSRFTINIKKGDGFGDFTSSFNVSSVKFTGLNVSGTLNVATDELSNVSTSDVETVDSKAVLKDAESKQIGYTYVAQAFPGTTLKDVTTTLLSITVDGNTYPITADQIYKALLANNSDKEDDIAALKAGKNYNLTINLKKTAIEITSAQLVDWEEIEGTEMTPSNAIALDATMEQNGGDASKVVASDLYRSTSLATGYTEKTTLAADGKTMGTTWYWPNNSTSYYFRTISPQNTAVTTADNDNITMTGGAIADANDYIWGAPLKETHDDGAAHKFTYDNGYGAYLYPVIGPTESEIHLTQFHMMSNIQVNLTTSEGDDKVDLTDATVEILNFNNTATLDLSNAKITITGGKTASQAMTAGAESKYTWRVIPQTTTGITLKITAAGNEYNVKLPANTGISAWLPGKSYVYSFKLVKTAIHITTAQLVDWETVTATGQTVTIE